MTAPDHQGWSDPDILRGLPAIAAFVGMSEIQAKKLADDGRLSCFRIEGEHGAFRTVLRGWLWTVEPAGAA